MIVLRLWTQIWTICAPGYGGLLCATALVPSGSAGLDFQPMAVDAGRDLLIFQCPLRRVPDGRMCL
jgi:hypothetical protein